MQQVHSGSFKEFYLECKSYASWDLRLHLLNVQVYASIKHMRKL